MKSQTKNPKHGSESAYSHHADHAAKHHSSYMFHKNLGNKSKAEIHKKVRDKHLKMMESHLIHAGKGNEVEQSKKDVTADYGYSQLSSSNEHLQRYGKKSKTTKFTPHKHD